MRTLTGCCAVVLLAAGSFNAAQADDRVAADGADVAAVVLADHANLPIWRAPEAVLYDNGPLVTHPGGGVNGANTSAIQTTLGLLTAGFAHAIGISVRVADDFVVPAGGWNIATVTVFAYQTGSTTTSTINDVRVQIWNGPPGAPGSAVVFGDTTTNRLISSSFTNIYRSVIGDLLANNRPIMANTVAINTILPPGSYWLDWTSGGTLASGPFAPPVTLLGQTSKPGANALQLTAGVWEPALDPPFAQDLPFIFDGALAGFGFQRIPALGQGAVVLLGLVLALGGLLAVRRRN